MGEKDAEYAALDAATDHDRGSLSFVRDGRIYVIENKGEGSERVVVSPTDNPNECKLFLQQLSPGFAMCLRAAGVLTDRAPHSAFWRVWPRVMDFVSVFSLIGWVIMIIMLLDGSENEFPGWVWGWREITIERDLTAVVGVMFTLQAPICLFFGRRYFAKNHFGCLASNVYHMCYVTFHKHTRRAVILTVLWPVLCSLISLSTLAPLYSHRDVPLGEIVMDCLVFGIVALLFFVTVTAMAVSFSLVTSLHHVQLGHCTNMLRRYAKGDSHESLAEIVQYHMGVRRCLAVSIRSLQTYFGLVTGLTFLGLLMQLWIFLDSSDSARGVRFMFAAFFSAPPILGMLNAAQVWQAAKTLYLTVSLLPVKAGEVGSLAPGALEDGSMEARSLNLQRVTFTQQYFTSWYLTGNIGFSVLGVPITPSVLARAVYGLITAALLIIQGKR